jgi:hypothetical protein
MVLPLRALVARGWAAALSLSLLACDRLSSDCVSIGRIAVAFTLRDSATNTAMTAGALVTLAGRTFTDSLILPPGESRSAIGPERDGPLLLTVQAPGFLRWERSLTIERSKHCSALQSVDLDVRLQRADPFRSE